MITFFILLSLGIMAIAFMFVTFAGAVAVAMGMLTFCYKTLAGIFRAFKEAKR